MEEPNANKPRSTRPKPATVAASRELAAKRGAGSPDQGSAYRALRRKYLLLEEESSALDRELRDAEETVDALQRDKAALLDQLVVLEGLVDPPPSVRA